jgi:hypothetical protein
MINLNQNKYVNLLKLSSLVTILTGVLSVLASSPVTEKPWLLLLDLLDWPFDGNPSAFTKESFILNAVLGGVMIGWGCLMFYVSDEIKKSPRLLRAMFVSLLCWFVTDSIGSFLSGVYGNIILNIIFLSMFLYPLMKLRHS